MRYTLLDIETAPHPCVSEFVTPPDLSTITAAKNLKDPAKIADDMAKRQDAATADYQQQLSRASLDWNLSRIVALAWTDESGEDNILTCEDEDAEVRALAVLWRRIRSVNDAPIIGFSARSFDLPTLIQRSRLLGVRYPFVSLARYGKGDVQDLRDLLTFDDARYEAIMPRTLKAFCKRFGIACDDAIGGADIPALVAAGDWAGVEAHVTSDLHLTRKLAEAINVIEPVRAQEPDPVMG